MAYLSKKGEIFVARFSYGGREYKKSLKTRNRSAADAVIHQIEVMLHRLCTGQLALPTDADPAEFILSAGSRCSQPGRPASVGLTLAKVVESYLGAMQLRISANYLSSQTTHLNHLRKHLKQRFNQPISQITTADLNHFLEERLKIRDANTVAKERITLIQFFKWCVQQRHLSQSPADPLSPIKAGREQPPFRTRSEIEQAIARPGIDQSVAADEWDRLYLSVAEVGDLLALVERNSLQKTSYLLHAIPAYTGMRRGEVLRLRWSDVDLQQGYLVAKSLKQSRSLREVSRHIDIHPRLMPILRQWQTQSSRGQFVICDPESLRPLEPSVANRLFWQPMRNTDWCLNSASNWFKVGFHTYRHSFASNLAAAGVDQRIIDEFMGHTTEAMRKRYRHLFPIIGGAQSSL